MVSSALITGSSLPAVSRLARYLNRDAQVFHRGDDAVLANQAVFHRRLDRRQRRDVPDHRQGAVFRVQREGDFPVHRHFVHRGFLRRSDPGFGDALFLRLVNHLRIVRIQEHLQLRFVQVFRVGHAGGVLRFCRRRTAARPDSGCGPRRFPSTRWAGRLRCAGSRRCTSRPCRDFQL